MNDSVNRQNAIDAINRYGSVWMEYTDAMSIDEIAERALKASKQSMVKILHDLPSAEPEIIYCCDCVYYDPEHIENKGVRYEYKDMPKDAFDILGTGLVNAEYGINVGGRCCRDYNAGYSEDKRVFVSKQNYCGRARRRQNE